MLKIVENYLSITFRLVDYDNSTHILYIFKIYLMISVVNVILLKHRFLVFQNDTSKLSFYLYTVLLNIQEYRDFGNYERYDFGKVTQMLSHK